MRARGKGSSPGGVEGSSRAMLATARPSCFLSQPRATRCSPRSAIQPVAESVNLFHDERSNASSSSAVMCFCGSDVQREGGTDSVAFHAACCFFSSRLTHDKCDAYMILMLIRNWTTASDNHRLVGSSQYIRNVGVGRRRASLGLRFLLSISCMCDD